MNFAAKIYVDANGNIYGASKTDQAHTRASCDTRTVGGRPVGYAGRWFGSQMSWQPYRDAINEAMYQAVLRACQPTTVERVI